MARSVETALHKLAELKFDLSRLVSAHGTAPLPPVAANDLAAIGRTNDAILYGARVVLAVTGDDASLEPRSGLRSHRRPRTIMASRSRRSSPATTTTFTPSTRTCSAPPKSSSRTSRQARFMLRTRSIRRCSIVRLPAYRSGAASHDVAGRLGFRFGWHVADLRRAAERIGVSLHAVPFPNVSATVGLDPSGLAECRGASVPAGST